MENGWKIENNRDQFSERFAMPTTDFLEADFWLVSPNSR